MRNNFKLFSINLHLAIFIHNLGRNTRKIVFQSDFSELSYSSFLVDIIIYICRILSLSCTGTCELIINLLPTLVASQLSQFIEHRTSIARSRVQIPLKIFFFRLLLRNCIICVHNCEDHSSLDKDYTARVHLIFSIKLPALRDMLRHFHGLYSFIKN